jgi:ATP/maltotriose-dependent transcriptional regulator MalT
MHVFARTKFQPPRPRADLITRERLDQLLRRALATARLVLVSAPAGAGKTTLVATALSTGPIQPVWVALDADDDELLRFLSLLIHAFERGPLVGGGAARRMLEGLGDAAAADRPQLGRWTTCTPSPTRPFSPRWICWSIACLPV